MKILYIRWFFVTFTSSDSYNFVSHQMIWHQQNTSILHMFYVPARKLKACIFRTSTHCRQTMTDSRNVETHFACVLLLRIFYIFWNLLKILVHIFLIVSKQIGKKENTNMFKKYKEYISVFKIHTANFCLCNNSSVTQNSILSEHHSPKEVLLIYSYVHFFHNENKTDRWRYSHEDLHSRYLEIALYGSENSLENSFILYYIR